MGGVCGEGLADGDPEGARERLGKEGREGVEWSAVQCSAKEVDRYGRMRYEIMGHGRCF